MTGDRWFDRFVVYAKTPADVPAVEEAVRRVVLRNHEHGDEFRVETGEEDLREVNNILMILKTVAIGVAAISLLVGGIGIMNIMLVSVTERTREIGIRKAMGAKRHTILRQFIVEAVVLCLVGGLLGIVFGQVLSQGFSALISNLINMPFHGSVSPILLVIAVGFSLIVGLTFGVYPAWRASRLDPVDALRYE
jgi:putative ABC transport system permease protein